MATYKDKFLGERPENPKVAGSGVTVCRPQVGTCPNDCPDCFYKGGRYYEDIAVPHIPDPDWVRENNLIVRMNDGNDSSHEFDLVVETAKEYDEVFFNTQHPHRISEFPGPVVLTVNGQYTDHAAWMVVDTKNLMAVRFRMNAWNIKLCADVVRYYEGRHVPVLLTFMAYYREKVEDPSRYVWKKRTTNSYWCITPETREMIEKYFRVNGETVLTCTTRESHACKDCENCEKLYRAWKSRKNQ